MDTTIALVALGSFMLPLVIRAACWLRYYLERPAPKSRLLSVDEFLESIDEYAGR